MANEDYKTLMAGVDSDLVPPSWENKGNILSVVGVGGGGCNAVSYMFTQGIDKVDFAVCNTDEQALNMSPVPTKLQIGWVTTKGLGAGTDFNVGRKAAEESIEDIGKLFNPNTQMVFVTCGMGGGTGTGAAPVVARVAKEKGYLTVGVVTIPFRDEGNEALYRATEGIKELNKYVDSLLVIDNQKLYDQFENLNVFSGFPKADEVLLTAVKSIAETITSRGYINVDFADVRKIMQNSGMAIMGIGKASGPDRAEQAVRQAFSSPLLNNLNLSNVNNVLLNIRSNNEEGKAATLGELSKIMDVTKEFTGTTSNFKRGIVMDPSMDSAISVTIIATGFDLAQLPVIDASEINIGARIDIRYNPSEVAARKKGIPINSKEKATLKKRHITGKPALITEDPAKLEELHRTAAYYRREMMLNKQTEENIPQ